MSVQSLGVQLSAWYDGKVCKVALCRPRSQKGRYLPFNNNNEYPAVILENKQTGVVRQDSDNKLYFVSN